MSETRGHTIEVESTWGKILVFFITVYIAAFTVDKMIDVGNRISEEGATYAIEERLTRLEKGVVQDRQRLGKIFNGMVKNQKILNKKMEKVRKTVQEEPEEESMPTEEESMPTEEPWWKIW